MISHYNLFQYKTKPLSMTVCHEDSAREWLGENLGKNGANWLAIGRSGLEWTVQFYFREQDDMMEFLLTWT